MTEKASRSNRRNALGSSMHCHRQQATLFVVLTWVLVASCLPFALSFHPPSIAGVGVRRQSPHSFRISQCSRKPPMSALGSQMSAENANGSDENLNPGFSRRHLLSTAALAGATFLGNAADAANSDADLFDGQWWVFPLAPYQTKKTTCTEIVAGQVWVLDQLLGALYVHVPLRSVVLKMEEGLLVFNTVAPTPECIKLVRELERLHGPVRHVILASAAIEHKRTAGPFARACPAAQLWVAPEQYSFPVGLDNVGLLGYTQLFWGTNPKPLPRDSQGSDVPWAKEASHLMLGPLRSNGGRSPGLFLDVAFLHKASGTLVVTDTLQSITPTVPPIFDHDPRALLFHARDDVSERVADSAEVRARGWARIQLFSLFFQPGGLDVIPWAQAVPEMSRGRMNELGWGGLFPFVWRPEGGPHPPGSGKRFWRESVAALSGRAFVPPILQTLILDREPHTVLAWADKLAGWQFSRVVGGHLASSSPLSPAELRGAFRFLEDAPPASYPADLDSAPLAGDAQFLREVSGALTGRGVVAAPDAGVEAARARRRAQAGLPPLAPRTGDGWGPFRN